jgi:hypothetical protein
MQPLTVILGIVLGSVFSIAFGLGIVLLIFGLRQGQDSRYALELPELATATVLFSMVSVVSAMAFLGSLRGTHWRHWAAIVLGVSLAGVGFYYWPD